MSDIASIVEDCRDDRYDEDGADHPATALFCRDRTMVWSF
ncbi:hypothetical protein GGD66_007952 [Bradyrhizobium sp. CIR48]|nr:hypothetical protein [Bradyrhizobium sp. CIR18]MBB4429350.1 hypothetical protein [Bradyrhizobium sp. CIR48]